PKTRLPGTGGGNDISSLTNMIVAMKHEKRRFVEHVDFITSPGFIRGGTSRRDSGLPSGGMWRVITELAIFGFDDRTRRIK
ncbi:CoA-transferase subunit beta, partial [Escherichia coli]|nr:CoA-transferase subunit beta [Escherichia coli]